MSTGKYKDYHTNSLISIIATVIYLITPVDFVSDMLPLGLMDDLMIISWALNVTSDELNMNHVCLDVRIICREEDKQGLLLAYVSIKIQESQYTSVFRFINKIQMDNFDSVSLFINEECNKLMSQSALNVGSDFRIDKDVFRFAFCPLLNILDDHFAELLRILSYLAKTKIKINRMKSQISFHYWNKMIRKRNICWVSSITRGKMWRKTWKGRSTFGDLLLTTDVKQQKLRCKIV